MTLTKEQAEDIKKQLLPQIDKLPNENKEQIKKYVQSLDEAGLEKFLKEQGIKNPFDSGSESSSNQTISNESAQSPESQCIFCSIISGKIPSYKIDENSKSIAILEINPVSKGHSIILPKSHVTTDKIPASSMTLARKIAKRIKSKFNPEDIKIETSSLMDHAMINIIPIYENQQLQKKKADDKELLELQKILSIKKRAKRHPSSKQNKTTNFSESSNKNLPQISFRIP